MLFLWFSLLFLVLRFILVISTIRLIEEHCDLALKQDLFGGLLTIKRRTVVILFFLVPSEKGFWNFILTEAMLNWTCC